jgi:hypothetical protein
MASSKKTELAGNGRFVHLTFDTVVLWLEECSAQCKALVVRVYTDELAKFVRASVNGEMPMNEATEIAELILNLDSHHLQAAFDVAESLALAKETLMTTFKRQLIDGLKNNVVSGIALDTSFDYDGKTINWWNVSSQKKYSGFSLSIASSKFVKPIQLRYEFDHLKFGDFFWGVTSFAKNRPDQDVLLSQQIFDLFSKTKIFNAEQHKSTPWWSYWTTSQASLGIPSNWNTSPRPWLDIRSGKMATDVIQHAIRVQLLLNTLGSSND